ncbi:unnamed protein product [Ixodes hexagonus]
MATASASVDVAIDKETMEVETPGETAEPETLEGRAAVIQEKLDTTYRQIVFLDQQIRDLKRLYRRAEQNNKYAFRYNIRMKMSIASGIKMMFYHYANTKATELERITAQMERSTASDTSDGV